MKPGNNSSTSNGTTNTPYYYDGSIELDLYFADPVVVIQLTLSFLIFITNGFFVLVFLARKALREKPSNTLLLSFAMCDILFGALIVCHVVSVFAADHTISSKKIEMRYLVISDILGNAVNCCCVFHLAAIAGERFVSLFSPLRHLVIVTQHRICILLLVIWLSAFSFPWIQLTYLYRVLDGEISPEDRVLIYRSEPVYSLVSWTVFTFVPMIVLAIVYMKMYLRIRKTIRRKEFGPHRCPKNCKSTGRVKSDSKAIGIFASMYVMFFVLSMPYFAARFIMDAATILNISPDIFPHLVLKMLYLLRCFVSFLNPLLYTGWKADVRKEALSFCFKKFRRRLTRPPGLTLKTNLLDFKNSSQYKCETNEKRIPKVTIELEKLTTSCNAKADEQGLLLSQADKSV